MKEGKERELQKMVENLRHALALEEEQGVAWFRAMHKTQNVVAPRAAERERESRREERSGANTSKQDDDLDLDLDIDADLK